MNIQSPTDRIRQATRLATLHEIAERMFENLTHDDECVILSYLLRRAAKEKPELMQRAIFNPKAKP